MSAADLSFLGVPENMEEAIQSLHETRLRRIKRFMWHRRDEDLAATKKRKVEAVEELEKEEEKRKAAKVAAEDPAPFLTVAASLLCSDSEEEDVLPPPPGPMAPETPAQLSQGGTTQEGAAAASSALASAALASEPARQSPELVAVPPWRRTPQSSAPTAPAPVGAAPAASVPTVSPPAFAPPPAGSPPDVAPPPAASPTSSTSRSSPTGPQAADAQAARRAQQQAALAAQQQAALAAQQQAAVAAQQQAVAGEQQQVQRACRHGFVRWYKECAECRTQWCQMYWAQQGGLCPHGHAVAQCQACSGTQQWHLLQQMKERQEAEQQQAQKFEVELQRRENQGRGATEAAVQPAAFWQPESRPLMPSEQWQWPRAAPDPRGGFVARLVQAGEGGIPAWIRHDLPRGDERAREKAASRNDRPKSQTICKSYCRHQGVEFPVGKCNWEATKEKKCEFHHPSDAVMEAAQRLMEQGTRGHQCPDDMWRAVVQVLEEQCSAVAAPGRYAARHPETS